MVLPCNELLALDILLFNMRTLRGPGYDVSPQWAVDRTAIVIFLGHYTNQGYSSGVIPVCTHEHQVRFLYMTLAREAPCLEKLRTSLKNGLGTLFCWHSGTK